MIKQSPVIPRTVLNDKPDKRHSGLRWSTLVPSVRSIDRDDFNPLVSFCWLRKEAMVKQTACMHFKTFENAERIWIESLDFEPCNRKV